MFALQWNTRYACVQQQDSWLLSYITNNNSFLWDLYLQLILSHRQIHCKLMVIRCLQISVCEPVFIHSIEIYETLNAGAIKEISIRHPQRGLITVWSGSPCVIKQSRIFKPRLQVTRIGFSNLARVTLTIFRSNSKLDQNLKCAGFKCTLPTTTNFCTRHGCVTVVTCAKFRCDRLSIF